MVLAENQIMERLKSVIDPEIGINIVDLGLIYNVESGDNKVNITMTLTTPGCPMHSSMPNWVKECVLSIAPNLEVDVQLVWQPPWTPEAMSDDAKHQLGRLR